MKTSLKLERVISTSKSLALECNSILNLPAIADITIHHNKQIHKHFSASQAQQT